LPDGRTHAFLGVTVGAATGVLVAPEEPDYAKLIVAMGAAFGGYAGGILPDVLEPPLHPHHRDFCHSVMLTGSLVAATGAPAGAATTELFAAAARLRAQRAALPPNDPNRFWLGAQEALCHLLSGAMVGFLAGYVSHVAADSTTSRGVPLMARGFL
jgi:membrane-bound metal-dependent hydrolase YbcI (DUF457 family)